MVYGKHFLTKKALTVILVVAASPFASAQTGVPSATTASNCEVPNPKKVVSVWADFSRYQEDNATLEPPRAGKKRGVFFGSSSIHNWGRIAIISSQ